MVLKILETEYEGLEKGDKMLLKHTEENPFYQFVIKLRTLLHILRDLNSRIGVKSIHKVIQMLIDFITELHGSGGDTLLMFSENEGEDLPPNTFTPNHAHHLKCVSRILGEALAKNLIDRKIILEFLFKVIDVDQPDEVLKDIGRDTIKTSLEFAEDDDSVDFFKYLP